MIHDSDRALKKGKPASPGECTPGEAGFLFLRKYPRCSLHEKMSAFSQQQGGRGEAHTYRFTSKHCEAPHGLSRVLPAACLTAGSPFKVKINYVILVSMTFCPQTHGHIDDETMQDSPGLQAGLYSSSQTVSSGW